MTITLSITGDRHAMHVALAELAVTAERMGLTIKLADSLSDAEPNVTTPVDASIRTASRLNGQWRKR